MNPTHRPETAGPETAGSDTVRYLVTIDLERGRTLKVLRQMPDGSLHEVTRRPLPQATDTQPSRGFQVSTDLATLH